MDLGLHKCTPCKWILYPPVWAWSQPFPLSYIVADGPYMNSICYSSSPLLCPVEVRHVVEKHLALGGVLSLELQLRLP